MGLFFYTKIGSIISIGDLPTTNIIEPVFLVSKTKNICCVCLYVCFNKSNYKNNKNIKKETKKNRKSLTTISYSVILIV